MSRVQRKTVCIDPAWPISCGGREGGTGDNLVIMSNRSSRKDGLPKCFPINARH